MGPMVCASTHRVIDYSEKRQKTAYRLMNRPAGGFLFSATNETN